MSIWNFVYFAVFKPYHFIYLNHLLNVMYGDFGEERERRAILGENYMFGHNKTLEKSLYQQKTTTKRKICKVSWPGPNSFYVVSRP